MSIILVYLLVGHEAISGSIIFSACPSVRPSVRSFARNHTSEHGISKTNKPILMQIDQVVHGKGMKLSTLGPGGRRSMSYEAKDKFGGGGTILDRFRLSSFYKQETQLSLRDRASAAHTEQQQ